MIARMPSIREAILLFTNYSRGRSTRFHVGTLNLQARKAKKIGDATSIPGWHKGDKYGRAVPLKTDELPRDPQFPVRKMVVADLKTH